MIGVPFKVWNSGPLWGLVHRLVKPMPKSCLQIGCSTGECARDVKGSLNSTRQVNLIIQKMATPFVMMMFRLAVTKRL